MGCPEASPPSGRALILAILIAVYAGGVYHAWRAVSVDRHELPDAAQVQQLASGLEGGAAAAAAAAAARGLCARPARLHATLLLHEPSSGAAVHLGSLLEQQLEPALADLTASSADAAGAAVPGDGPAPVIISSSVVLHPPPLPAEQLRWDALRQAHVLSSGPAASWAQRVQRAAWAAGQAHDDGLAGAAAVLLSVLPLQHPPLLLEGLDGRLRSSWQVGEGSLLLVADLPSQPQQSIDGYERVGSSCAGGSSGSRTHGAVNPSISNSTAGSCSDSGGTQEQLLAGDILSWLLQPLSGGEEQGWEMGAAGAGNASDPGSNTSQEALVQRLRRRLAAACSADAAAAVHRFVAGAAAAPRQPVTAAASQHAAGAVRLLQTAAAALRAATHPQQQQEQQQQQPEGSGGTAEMAAAVASALAASFGAWAASRALLADADTGAHPVFPPEHALAVLMPLALPVTLVLAQAVGREAAAARKARRRPPASQAAGKAAAAGHTAAATEKID